MDLAVLDRVHDVGAALLDLVDAGRLDAVPHQELPRAFGGEDAEPHVLEALGRFQNAALVPVRDRDEHRAFEREREFGRFLRLVEREAEIIGQAEHLAGGAHLRAEHRVDLGEHVEGEHGLLHAEMPERDPFQLEVGQLFTQHDLGRDLGHRDVAHLGNQGHGPRGAGVGLEDVHGAAGDRVLDVDEAHHAELQRDAARVFLDRFHVLVGKAHGRDDAGRIARVDARVLDVLHHRGHEGVLSVAQGIGFGLDRVLEEFVDQNGPFGRDVHGRGDVAPEHGLVEHDLHGASPQHVRGPDHEGIPDAFGDGQRLLQRARHSGVRLGNPELLHHLPETVPVLGEIDGLGRGAHDPHARSREFGGDVQRGLAAELDNGALRPLLLPDGQHVLHGQRFEIQLVRGVEVGGHGFGVAVDHDGFEPGVADGESGVHAAIVEFNALADAVRPAAEHHDLSAAAHLNRVRSVVGREVIRRVLHAADADRLPGVLHAERDAAVAEFPLGNAEQSGEVLVREPVLFRADQELIRQAAALVPENLLLQVHQFLHLPDEPFLDIGSRRQLGDIRALAQGLVHQELALAGGHGQELDQLVERFCVEVLGEAKSGPADFKRADGFLQGLFVVLADAHHFADRAHLGAEPVLDALELFESPAREFHDHVIAAGGVFVQRSLAPVRNLVHGQAACEQGRDKGDREPRGLGGERRRAGRARIDLDDCHPTGFGVMRELDVGAADDFDGLDDVVGVFLEFFLQGGVDGQHRRGAVRVSGVHAHGVDVLDEANRDHAVLRVAHHLQLEFLPAQNGFLDQHLVHHAFGQAPRCDGPQLLNVVDQASARSPHGVGRPDHHRIPELFRLFFRVFEGVHGLAFRHVDAEPGHGLLESRAVLAAFDGIDVDADDLHAVFFKNAAFGELGGEIETGLASEIGEKGVRFFFCDDLFEVVGVQGLDIGGVRHAGIGHDGGRVGVDQDDFIPQFPERLAGLGAGIIEFAGLADDDRAGSDDEHFADIVAFRHGKIPLTNGWSCGLKLKKLIK